VAVTPVIRPHHRRVAGLALFLVTITSACGNGDDASPPTTTTTRPRATTTERPTTTTTTQPAPSDGDISKVRARVEEISRAEMPTDLAWRPGEPDAMYVAEREGRVVRVRLDDRGDDGQPGRETVLDLRDDTSTEGERGLLAIAFSPNGRRLYVHHSGADGHNHLVEYRVRRDGSVAAGSRRELLVVEQDSPVHKAGDLAVDNDGLLFVALGDGGPAGDPRDRAQNVGEWYGSILRIDPRPPEGEAAAPYTVPDGNPGHPRPEIFVHGLRNPWRISLDRPTGDLWIGDVGQYIWEEINWLPAGEQAGTNLGWNRFEGNHRFAQASGPPPPDHVPPLHEYNHDDGGCAVTGGFVYRGAAIRRLPGAYVFTDLCDGRVRALTHRGREVLDVRVIAEAPTQVVTFGQDLDGELYLASLDGRIMKLVPA